MTTDLELTANVATTASQLANELTILTTSENPALARAASNELYWVTQMTRRLAQVAVLAAREVPINGVEEVEP